MRIESVTAHAFGPLAGETLELAPGLTVLAGVNESAKSSWHAALYAALCGRGGGVPSAVDRRLVERYKPWDGGADWKLATTVVLDDGRRLELSQDLEDRARSRVVERREDDSTADVAAEIDAGSGPDASRWLGLDRAAFAAVALVDQAEHRAVRDAADGLQQYLRRAAESTNGGGSAAPALVALDRFLQDRLGGDRPGSGRAGPLPLAQERLRLAREARVVARRGHEQYLSDLAVAGERRTATADSAARLARAEKGVRALEEVTDAARLAEEARAAADRARAEMAAAASAYDAATGTIAPVPLQNSGPVQGSGPVVVADGYVDDREDEELLDTVASARTAWDAAPAAPALEGPSAGQLRAELAALSGEALDPQVRTLAEEHLAAMAAAGTHADRPTPRPAPRSGPRAGELRGAADALEAPPVPAAASDLSDPELNELRSAVEAARTRQRAAAEAAETAEREAQAAEERYQQMRATAGSSRAKRASRAANRLKAPVLTIVGVGVGLAALYFGLLAAVLVSALVILPVAVSLLAAVVVAVRKMRPRSSTTRTGPDGRPVVEDLVGAIVTVREKRAVAGQARVEARNADRHAAECRERHVAALRGVRPNPAREQALAWCREHGLPTVPAELRAVADRTERADAQAAERDAARGRLTAAVASTGDALRAALRERGILDEGSPLDQFARYETGTAQGAEHRGELEQALATRVAAEESAERVAMARREAVARLRTAAGAVGLDTAGDPEHLVAALDGWRAARPLRGGLAVAERPRPIASNGVAANGNGNGHHGGNGHGGNGHGGNGHGGNGNGNGHGGNGTGSSAELAALLTGGGRSADELRELRDERLAQAWRADLDACEARRRRDDLAGTAGVDPVRSGDRTFLAGLLEAARTELTGARTAAAGVQSGPTAVPTEAPAVARADEEVDAAEAHVRRMEQLRRTTALSRRYLARAQEQTHRDIAPVLAETLRGWLPGVTRGRYVDALVDPETLAVKVFGPKGRWRAADELSAGTADQVYLLLRVALAQHLAASGETCPLLLDGVTAQADGARTTEILDLLLRLAGERQVVLFTQEDAVLAWAREHLDGDRHRVRELAPLPSN